MKKLDKIVDIEKKIKKEAGFKPNEEQLQKIASKESVEAEIAEIKGYLWMYSSTKSNTESIERELKKQHKKELAQAKKAAVTTIANMITMHSMIECGNAIPEDIEDGVKHFSECLKKILVDGKEPSHWRQERDCFISCWTKLVNGSQDEIPHSETTFEEVSAGVAECISSGGFPEVIKRPFKQREPKKRVPKAKEAE